MIDSFRIIRNDSGAAEENRSPGFGVHVRAAYLLRYEWRTFWFRQIRGERYTVKNSTNPRGRGARALHRGFFERRNSRTYLKRSVQGRKRYYYYYLIGASTVFLLALPSYGVARNIIEHRLSV